MYRERSVLALAPAFNEETKIGEVVRRTPRDVVDEVLVVDDASTDRTAEVARAYGATVIQNSRRSGAGFSVRAGYAYAVSKCYDVAVVMAGNNKDSPEEIPLLLGPIVEGATDFVMGSRFLKRDADFGAMPLYRRLATRAHPLLFSIVARRKVTESTNGFRAVHRRVLMDPRMNLDYPRLREYDFEIYFHLRLIRLGYRTEEVPVTKIYPPKHLGQTKMKPITGWWSMLRPVVYVALGIWE